MKQMTTVVVAALVGAGAAVAVGAVAQDDEIGAGSRMRPAPIQATPELATMPGPEPEPPPMKPGVPFPVSPKWAEPYPMMSGGGPEPLCAQMLEAATGNAERSVQRILTQMLAAKPEATHMYWFEHTQIFGESGVFCIW